MTTNELINAVLVRTRDSAGTATPRALVRELLSYFQQSVNIAHRDVMFELSLTTERRRLLYDLRNLTTSVARVEAVRVGDHLLSKVDDWRELAATDRSWFRRMGDGLRLWAPCGREWIILYPGLEVTQSVTLITTKLVTRLYTDATPPELPAVRQAALVDLVEGLVLARRRLFLSVKPSTTNAGAKLQQDAAA